VIQDWGQIKQPRLVAQNMLARFADLPIIDCGPIANGQGHLRAIFGMTTTESSFKSILGLGMLLLAHEQGHLKPGQPVIESTSGSFGLALALAGKILGNPIELVTDPNIPTLTQRKIELLDAQLHLITTPHPTGGTQQARDTLRQHHMQQRPGMYWPNQNDNPLNPTTYRRWLIPTITPKLDLDWIDAAIFVVGTGGHFVALAELLHTHNIPTYVADRTGSITFGGTPAPSTLRGIGNQNTIPNIIGTHLHLVEDVTYFTDTDAAHGVQQLARRGIYAGGSSGIAYMGANHLATHTKARNILTFFPDRGDLYGNQFLSTPQNTRLERAAS